ncbi:MAG TPA: hypothetical protein VG711_08915 [Phycisphaerales bacterium]|nr:hypothetical protein [Phycisphaerales bacterium]
MPLASDYRIGRSTGLCAATGQPMPPGEPCIATLCENPADDSLLRSDVSTLAWDAGFRPVGLIAYWRTTVQPPDAPRRMLLDDNTLIELFERLSQSDTNQRLAFRFVLGLILLRKKLLKYVGRTPASSAASKKSLSAESASGQPAPASRDIWLLQLKGAPEGAPPIEMIDPQLSEDNLADLTDQLSQILNSEL